MMVISGMRASRAWLAKEVEWMKRLLRASFLEFVMNHPKEESPAGDFIADAQRASDFHDARTWRELEQWLIRQGVPNSTIESGKLVWKRYRAFKS
jgi:hypothetical protein